eukprot:CAMPEP_0184432914 /NCGR_PEP_ID=MMETSP0738-20130409/368715_1 /TAXON_ID=385413 /ORGANISM="Thalassiosira miniscula, Strain CCMP1093" /LENGTH=57 /DNA_ID=CAMNT_0026798399 /DNA_START=113 /DNA_END=283 /DNA_ORIENTATION=-
MQRTEPPAVSIVGMESGTSLAVFSVIVICAGWSASTAVWDKANRRLFPVNSMAFPAK